MLPNWIFEKSYVPVVAVPGTPSIRTAVGPELVSDAPRRRCGCPGTSFVKLVCRIDSLDENSVARPVNGVAPGPARVITLL